VEIFFKIAKRGKPDHAAKGLLHCTRVEQTEAPPRDWQQPRMWNWLTFWRRKGSPSLSRWRVVMYTRAGCHLCDAAWTLLEAAQRRYGFVLMKTDIDADAKLIADYGLEVPVVAVNGKVRFRGVVNAVLLQRLFDAGAG
jgi:glutaredoxin